MVGVVLAAAGSEAATRARDPTRFMVTRRLREKRELGGREKDAVYQVDEL